MTLYCANIKGQLCFIDQGIWNRFDKLVFEKIKEPIYHSSDLPVVWWEETVGSQIRALGYNGSDNTWTSLDLSVKWFSLEGLVCLVFLMMILLAGLVGLALCTATGRTWMRRGYDWLRQGLRLAWFSQGQNETPTTQGQNETPAQLSIETEVGSQLALNWSFDGVWKTTFEDGTGGVNNETAPPTEEEETEEHSLKEIIVI